MPVAMLLFLKATETAKPEELTARVHRALLRRLVEASVLSAQALERAPHPYTLSLLMPAEEGQGLREDWHSNGSVAFRHGGRFCLRMTWLDDLQLDAFLRWAPAQKPVPLYADLDSEPVLLEGARVAPIGSDRWTLGLPYARLYEEASDTLREVTLKFCSPTLLNRAGVPYPLPDPQATFLGYLNLWKNFSGGIALDPAFRTVLEEELTVVDFRIRAQSFTEDKGRSRTCFMGTATFRLEGRHPEKVIKSFNLVTDYAFFCGTGTGTHRGMGVTRRVKSRAGEF